MPLFVTFLFLFLLIVLENTVILTTVILDSHLHTPMYVFLCVLSCLDISYVSTTLPKLLTMIYTQRKTISFVGCMVQLYFFLSFVCTEFLLLAAMAYDRYVAICHPLHYSLIMSQKHCAKLLAVVGIIGFLDPGLFAVLISNLSYCSSNHIDHFFCDVSPVLKLTCSDTSILEILIYINGALVGSGALVLTQPLMFSLYCNSENLNVSRRTKSFSTCTSHLTCVGVFYGTIICMDTSP
ncbi:hypothetical protein GDO86_013579 [Hymenochirus boettgeri]|uniref:Olfactory receptor n=1 Tax=Hymenochirus boettgeri TaxID=247094 RepID=A0A8T2IZY5_9PIPI|nr:hypothetical protein GDO86_013579 [Hymenochirus boettgeri]